MNKYSNADRYIDSATGVLKNKLNITSDPALNKAEGDLAIWRSYELAQQPITGQFDLQHLQSIHRHLFQDVYEWAGEIRDIDISKGATYFAHYNHIESAARPLFAELSQENHLQGLDKDQFISRAAHYLGEINVLHPFREGNGRTQREFINQLGREQGYSFAWKHITQERMIEACNASYHGNNHLLEDAMRSCFVHVRQHEKITSDIDMNIARTADLRNSMLAFAGRRIEQAKGSENREEQVFALQQAVRYTSGAVNLAVSGEAVESEINRSQIEALAPQIDKLYSAYQEVFEIYPSLVKERALRSATNGIDAVKNSFIQKEREKQQPSLDKETGLEIE